MLAISWNIYHRFVVTAQNSQYITLSLNNADHLQKVLTAIINSETAGNESLVTGQTLLPAYEAAINTAKKEIDPESLSAAMPDNEKEIDRLHSYIEDGMQVINSSVNPLDVNAAHDPAGQEMPRADDIKARVLLDNIKQTTGHLYARQMQFLYRYMAVQETENRRVLFTLGTMVLLCLLLGWAFLVVVKQHRNLRRQMEKALSDALYQAEEIGRSKTHFLSTINHSIRTPLNSAIGMTSLLMQTPLSGEQKKYISTIHQSNVSLLSVINDILDFSRIEAGSLQLEQAPFQLQRCIEEVLLLVLPGDNRLSVTYEIAPDVPSLVLGDHSRLRQVLINLIGNALKQMTQGSVHLKVFIKSRQAEELEIGFTITDTSTVQLAAAEDALAGRLLDGSSPASLGGGQIGLGMSVSIRLVSLMGGSFKVETLAGKGNVVGFTIRTRSLTEAEQVPVAEEPAEMPIDTRLAQEMPLRILIVDDNEMNQFLLSSVLIKMGYPSAVARNGAEAVAMAIEGKYDLIFMDLQMPVMDGMEATKRIREYFVASPLPVIVGLSANALLKEKETSLQAGFSDFMIKPYKPQDIQQILLKWGNSLQSTTGDKFS